MHYFCRFRFTNYFYVVKYSRVKVLKCENLTQKQIFRRVNMNSKIRTEAVDQLFDAILQLENKEECYNFFEDLCTVNELLALSQRFAVAKMLKEKKTYLEIADKTGASTATISRVNHSLNYGCDGYELIFQRLEKKDDQ